MRGWSHEDIPDVFPEVRERAVRMVREPQGEPDSQCAAIVSMASKIGGTAETRRRWMRQAEKDSGQRDGLASAERERPKALEREGHQRCQANESLCKASAYFIQAEIDRPVKR